MICSARHGMHGHPAAYPPAPEPLRRRRILFRPGPRGATHAFTPVATCAFFSDRAARCSSRVCAGCHLRILFRPGPRGAAHAFALVATLRILFRPGPRGATHAFTPVATCAFFSTRAARCSSRVCAGRRQSYGKVFRISVSVAYRHTACPLRRIIMPWRMGLGRVRTVEARPPCVRKLRLPRPWKWQPRPRCRHTRPGPCPRYPGWKN